MDRWYNTETYYITSADTDAAYEYKASGIFVLLQKVCSEHARNLIVNRDEIMAKYNCNWMALRTYLKLYRPMFWAETVTAKSIIRKPAGKRLYWDCELYVGDTLVGEASTIWCMVNLSTKKSINIEGFPEFPTMDPPGAKNITLSRIEFPDNMEFHDKRKLYYSDTDVNGHLNNTRYVDLACDAAELHLRPKGVFLQEILMCYVDECFAGEELTFYRGKDNGYLYIHGIGPDGSDRFDCKIKMSSTEGL